MPVNDQPRDDMPALLRANAARPGPAGPDCFDEETIAAVVDGALDPGQRGAAIEHLAACARCRSAVASVSRLLADEAVVAAAEGHAPRAGRRWGVPLGLAAAAALVLVLAWPQRVANDRTTHRDPTLSGGSAPTLVAPVGAVAAADVLQWRAVAGASRYRLTLFDAQGGVLYETQLADTAALLPDSVVVVPGSTYLWKVEARTGWDRWTASELVEFRVAAASRP